MQLKGRVIQKQRDWQRLQLRLLFLFINNDFSFDRKLQRRNFWGCLFSLNILATLVKSTPEALAQCLAFLTIWFIFTWQYIWFAVAHCVVRGVRDEHRLAPYATDTWSHWSQWMRIQDKAIHCTLLLLFLEFSWGFLVLLFIHRFILFFKVQLLCRIIQLLFQFLNLFFGCNQSW